MITGSLTMGPWGIHGVSMRQRDAIRHWISRAQSGPPSTSFLKFSCACAPHLDRNMPTVTVLYRYFKVQIGTCCVFMMSSAALPLPCRAWPTATLCDAELVGIPAPSGRDGAPPRAAAPNVSDSITLPVSYQYCTGGHVLPLIHTVPVRY